MYELTAHSIWMMPLAREGGGWPCAERCKVQTERFRVSIKNSLNMLKQFSQQVAHKFGRARFFFRKFSTLQILRIFKWFRGKISPQIMNFHKNRHTRKSHYGAFIGVYNDHNSLFSPSFSTNWESEIISGTGKKCIIFVSFRGSWSCSCAWVLFPPPVPNIFLPLLCSAASFQVSALETQIRECDEDDSSSQMQAFFARHLGFFPIK